VVQKELLGAFQQPANNKMTPSSFDLSGMDMEFGIDALYAQSIMGSALRMRRTAQDSVIEGCA